MMGTLQITVYGRGTSCPPGGFNFYALKMTVPLLVLVGPADCWPRPLPAYCFTNNTGPILHSMPSWPSGDVSVIAASLVLSLRAVFPHTNAPLEVQQRVFHLQRRNMGRKLCVSLFTEDGPLNDSLTSLKRISPFFSCCHRANITSGNHSFVAGSLLHLV